MLHNLFVVNKAGGLIYHKAFSQKSQIGGNDSLRLGSTFHSLYAMSAQISPVKNSSGIQVLHADTFTLQCLHTITGIKFFVTADPGSKELDSFLRKVYELYADYVLKNPFYELDQVIKCDLFDFHLEKHVAESSR